MDTVIGPVLTRPGGYGFDVWTVTNGVSRGYPYRRIEDACYARNAEIRASAQRQPANMVAGTSKRGLLVPGRQRPARPRLGAGGCKTHGNVGPTDGRLYLGRPAPT